MKTQDEILKIRAAVLYILSKFQEGIDYIKLYKILYFAQQMHLVEYGVPIIATSFQAKKKGPVAGFVGSGIQRINEGGSVPAGFRLFAEGIETDQTASIEKIFSKESPDMEELSISNVRCLDCFINKFHDMDSETVSKISHEDTAWQRAWERSKKDPQLSFITLLEMAEAGGASKDTLFHIKENLELDEFLK